MASHDVVFFQVLPDARRWTEVSSCMWCKLLEECRTLGASYELASVVMIFAHGT